MIVLNIGSLFITMFVCFMLGAISCEVILKKIRSKKDKKNKETE